MDKHSLTTTLERKALQIGFDLAAATPVEVPIDLANLRQGLDLGFAAEMQFFSERIEAYADPNLILPGVKSALMLGTNYRTVEPIEPGAGQGRVSRYAWGADYHVLLRGRLHELAVFFQQLVPNGKARGIVDTAPFLEKSFAAQAGLGWIGKNTLLINPQFGSWIFLAALLVTEELSYAPLPWRARQEVKDCGDCRACLDACPTGALVAPYRLDARKCVSYLTIEHRGEIPLDSQSPIGSRLFGCDACQEACPLNRGTPTTSETQFHPREGMNPVDLAELQALDEQSFSHRFHGTPLMRAKREGILRNATIVRNNEKNIHCE